MELEQLSDNIRIQDANTYSLRNALSESDLAKMKEFENAVAALEELKAMYEDLEQYKETVEDVVSCMTNIAKDLLNIGYGNNKETDLQKVFNNLLDDIQEGIDDYHNIVEELEG